jgi:hypothetical protein
MMETIVDWSDAAMIGGMCLSTAALVLYLRQVLLNARRVRYGIDLATAMQTGSARQDSYLGALWFGLLVVQASQIFEQIQRGAAPQRIMFSLVSAVLVALICGCFAGRLTMRLHWRSEAAAEKRDGKPFGRA